MRRFHGRSSTTCLLCLTLHSYRQSVCNYFFVAILYICWHGVFHYQPPVDTLGLGWLAPPPPPPPTYLFVAILYICWHGVFHYQPPVDTLGLGWLPPLTPPPPSQLLTCSYPIYLLAWGIPLSATCGHVGFGTVGPPLPPPPPNYLFVAVLYICWHGVFHYQPPVDTLGLGWLPPPPPPQLLICSYPIYLLAWGIPLSATCGHVGFGMVAPPPQKKKQNKKTQANSYLL